jgi:hypothetical protein
MKDGLTAAGELAVPCETAEIVPHRMEAVRPYPLRGRANAAHCPKGHYRLAKSSVTMVQSGLPSMRHAERRFVCGVNHERLQRGRAC